ncbi:MAG: flagellar filament capping protein FliD [Synergistaceae bacterium]|nr:flagellar filament capping protein FliD [Synergistaceae bacterium]
MAINSEALFSMPGVASGIDWGGMADTIIEYDSKPIYQWEAQQEKLELKVSLYEEFSSLFKALRSTVTPLKLGSTYTAKAAEFTPLGGAASSAGIITATATADAQINKYEIEVIAKAQAHRVAGDQVEDASAALGLSGTFSIAAGDLGPVEITVGTNDSLSSIVTKINEAATKWGTENQTAPMATAKLLDRRIVLTSGATGAAKEFTFTDDDNILEGLGILDNTKAVAFELDAAQDAELIIDGLTVTRETNEITDLIDNVTLNIVGPGKVAMDITLDAQNAVEGVQEFVGAYNEIMDWINIRLSEETVKDPKSDFERKWGLLHGDSMLWQAKSQLRSLVATPLNVSFSSRTSNQLYRQFGPLTSNDYEAVIRNDTSFTLYHGGKQATIDVKVTDTWDTLAAKINSAVDNDSGEAMGLKASVTEGRLTLSGKEGVTVADPGNFLSRTGLRTVTQASQIGVFTEEADFGKSGKLEFSTDDLMAALTANPNQVAEFASQLMGKLDTFIGDMADASTVQVGTTVAVKGKVAGQIQTWQSEISNLDKRISDFQARLEQKRMRLLTQFSAAETNLAKLNEQLSWLTSVNSVMTGNAGNNG